MRVRQWIYLALLGISLSGCAAKPPTPAYEALLRQAKITYEQGDMHKSESLWRQLVGVHAELAIVHQYLGHISFRFGRWQEAYSHYQSSLALDAEQPHLWHNLAVIRLRQATETLLKAQQYQPLADDEKLLAQLLKMQRMEHLLHESKAAETTE